jgi:hypothetical protein
MARVNLDAMIRREDFAVEDREFDLDLFQSFPISNLAADSPILKLLRKPDFQRETNHWRPDQIATFIASFLDNEVIPSLILWKSPALVFVIDGGHRLSALRAWMLDDYGDGPLSREFYGGEISDEQKKAAKAARTLIERNIGRFSTLEKMVDSKAANIESRRANRLFTRSLNLQWVQGTASVAESSFYKINTQGTPLDDTEELLIRNRRKPIAIGARAVIRAGTGHKYWSSFPEQNAEKVEKLAADFYKLVFEPEAFPPLKTLDVPIGGSVSPVDALSLLIETFTISGTKNNIPLGIKDYPDDADGSLTISVLENALSVIRRITGNAPGSLGLHPAVYFYNERGKYSRFFFLGILALISEKLRVNDQTYFKKFTKSRENVETFLLENKSILGIVLQNLSRGQRVNKMRDLFMFLIDEISKGDVVTPERAIEHLGLQGRILDVKAIQEAPKFTDDTKSMVFLQQALKGAIRCDICSGYLDPNKSVSYDHKKPIREGGTGDSSNVQLSHPYCNTGYKN